MGCNCGKKPPKVMTTAEARQIARGDQQTQTQATETKTPQPAAK